MYQTSTYRAGPVCAGPGRADTAGHGSACTWQGGLGLLVRFGRMILLLAHKKGGVGKSTLAINLALEAAKAGRSLVLVDANPTIDTATTWSNDREEAGHEPAIQVLQRGGSGLHHELTRLDDAHDVVVVDAPGKDSEEMRLGLVVADIVLVPLEPAQASTDQTEKLVNTIEKARELNPQLRAMAVLSWVDTHVWDRTASDATKILAGFPELAGVRIHTRDAFRDCLEGGRGVSEMRDSKARAEIQLLAKEVFQW